MRRVRDESDAHPHASEGVRAIFAKGSTAHGGARPEARRRSGQGHAQVPLMPNSITAELSTWLEERHAEMNGETARVLELSSRLSKGAEHLMEITGGMCS